MSIFGNLWDRITGQRDAKPGAGGAPSFSNVGGSSTSTAPPAARAPAAPATPAAPVDVEAIMTELERKSGHKSNWRVSIVDLMSLLGMDNSLAERKELAKELGYTGDMNDSATMNMWLHKQVMKKMAENGGKVPANMLD